MNPYNFAASVGRALDAGATTLLDPGADGTVTVAPKGVAILVINTTGARTLQSADGVDIGAEVLVIATASSVSVNSIDIADGGHAVFKVTLDASGDNQWVAVENSAALPANLVTRATAAAAGGLVAVSGGADKTLVAATPVDLGTVNINTGDPTTDTALIALVDALTAFGLTTATWT